MYLVSIFFSTIAGWMLIEAIKKLAGGRKSSLTEEEAVELHTLYSMHMVKDESGRPIWYMPPGLKQNQYKVLELLRDISRNQVEILKILEKLNDKN